MSSSHPISVGLVDDQPLVRAGFAMVIGTQADMRVAFEATHGREALQLLRSHRVDVLVMDVRMPEMDGIEATSRVMAEFAQRAPRIIMLTTFDLDEYVADAIRAGASGFLLKDTMPEDLLSAIRTVHRGDAVIAPSATRRLFSSIAHGHSHGSQVDVEALACLSDREREVLEHMARGLSNTEIARELYLAEATVKTHVGRILNKVGARDRVQAVIFAFDTGLVNPKSL